MNSDSTYPQARRKYFRWHCPRRITGFSILFKSYDEDCSPRFASVTGSLRMMVMLLSYTFTLARQGEIRSCSTHHGTGPHDAPKASIYSSKNATDVQPSDL